ncbi:hypothetical protein FHR87_000980 [Azomonas macrocytogenes]|uniref:Uncharacterized protein n=1 Tax=Azomonas macrocytogenes TaxID=69962 RepID=A0A839SZ32_AZOMA|nr:hypothetical protein [Azomonas macrocytogenes]
MKAGTVSSSRQGWANSTFEDRFRQIAIMDRRKASVAPPRALLPVTRIYLYEPMHFDHLDNLHYSPAPGEF